MPQTLSDVTFNALRETIRQIDFRTKRLLEWRALGMTTLATESRFDVFMAKHKAATDPPLADQLADLRDAWLDCDRNLIELSLLPGGLEAITLTLGDRSADPTVKTWVDDLVTTGKLVGNDLLRRSFEDLKAHTADYKAAYMKLGIQRDAKVQLEITQLATLTNELKLKFDAV
jgi:hypothetical protein